MSGGVRGSGEGGWSGRVATESGECRSQKGGMRSGEGRPGGVVRRSGLVRWSGELRGSGEQWGVVRRG